MASELKIGIDGTSTRLFVNGVVVAGSVIRISEPHIIHAGIPTYRGAKLVLGCTLEELTNSLASLRIGQLRFELPRGFEYIHVIFSESAYTIRFDYVTTGRPHADLPFSLAQLVKAFSSGTVATRYGFDYDGSPVDFEHGFSLSRSGNKFDRALDGEIEDAVISLKGLLSEVQITLSETPAVDKLVTLFRFPPEVQTACEQYLVYFVQFLADLGIEASADITHEAGQVLFSVVPKDGEEALQQIKKALAVYLTIPSAPTSTQPRDADIANLQLQANVSHLNAQIQLAQATHMAQSATISMLQLTNYQLIQLIADNSFRQAEDTENEQPTEPIIEGVVSAKDIEVMGATIHVVDMLRKLKRRFKGKGETGK